MPYKSRCSAFLFVPVLGISTPISEKTTEKLTEKIAPFLVSVQAVTDNQRRLRITSSLDI